jgi:hypothetical protein
MPVEQRGELLRVIPGTLDNVCIVSEKEPVVAHP